MSVTGLLTTNPAYNLGRKRPKVYLLAQKRKLNKESSLDVRYGKTHIRQYLTATTLACTLDEELSEEYKALNDINKKR